MQPDQGEATHYVFSALIDDEPVALERFLAMVRVRKLGIVSWSVGSSEQAGLSRLTIEVEGGDMAAQCHTQVAKLIPVAKVESLSEGSYVAMCSALVRLEAKGKRLDRAHAYLQSSEARLLSLEKESLVAQISGSVRCVEKVVRELKTLGELEWIRTNLMALRR